ncbi:hypothetical protein, partial [Ralstonia pseudosolanacearum]|uniref:hypothetical protein n=1 Tax=Ralstonia pseudosolanacearum TaxID=1310165 RepID=UPI003CEE2D2D
MAHPVAATTAHYVEGAFNSNDGSEEAILFSADQCLKFNYAAPNDFIIKGPLSISDFFPSLKITDFATGIDSAFTSSNKNEVYMFKDDSCLILDFVNDKIIEPLKPITDFFKKLENTPFEYKINAAFATHKPNEAYIFSGNQCALFNFKEDEFVIHPKKITSCFPKLVGSDFGGGLDAAFMSTKGNEAYIFKGNDYAIINYAKDG